MKDNGSAAGSNFRMVRNHIVSTIARMIARGDFGRDTFRHIFISWWCETSYVLASLVIIIRLISPRFPRDIVHESRRANMY